ncbi:MULTISPECIES: hypothetical protein [unclassified Streptomyces]|uniref:hypothetical protein n=1 Tax=unclassified Streptomyces TaxID=2593676 RepID=UPI002152AFAB|nr:hypothetical protein [Streptomyces sp. CB02959]
MAHVPGKFANEYPWQWTPAHMDERSASLRSEKHLAPSTIRSYVDGQWKYPVL